MSTSQAPSDPPRMTTATPSRTGGEATAPGDTPSCCLGHYRSCTPIVCARCVVLSIGLAIWRTGGLESRLCMESALE
eukprot:2249524-Rhodomonas_salina.2